MPDSDPYTRRCAAAENCADRFPERDDTGKPTGRWLPAAITAERGLCAACTRDVGYALGHFVGDVVELSMLIGSGDTIAETVVASSPDPTVPIRLALDALRTEIDDELQNWAEPVAEKLGVLWDTTGMGRSRIGPRVQRAAHLLVESVDTLIALPGQEHSAWAAGEPVWDLELGCQDVVVRDGITAGLDFIDLHRRCYAALGRTKLVHRLPTPCPWCDRSTLVRHNGADCVECEHCHRQIEEKYYSWFVAVLVREEQRHVAEQRDVDARLAAMIEKARIEVAA
jgi:hypothetical protein